LKDLKRLVPPHFHREDLSSYQRKLLTRLENVLTAMQEEKWDQTTMGKGGDSKVHPLLEKSGALRLCVELPKDNQELCMLCDFVLGQHNTYNEDTIHYGPNFFTRFQMGPKRHLTTEVGERLTALIFDGLSNKDIEDPYCPNLVKLLSSVLYEQIDLQYYDSRGRYGKGTVERLIYGNVHQKPDRVIHGFIFETSTNTPVGFICISVFETKDKKPVIFHHYGFTGLQAAREMISSNVMQHMPTHFNHRPPRTSEVLLALAIAYIYKHIYQRKVKIEDFIYVAHTDKSAAVKFMRHVIGKIDNDEPLITEVVRTAFAKITDQSALNNGNYFFLENLEVEGFPFICAADHSAVAHGDPGEEVPDPGGPFYRTIYQTYRHRLLAEGAKEVPEKLVNCEMSLDLICREFRVEQDETLKNAIKIAFDLLQQPRWESREPANGKEPIINRYDGILRLSSVLKINNFRACNKLLIEGLEEVRPYLHNNHSDLDYEGFCRQMTRILLTANTKSLGDSRRRLNAGCEVLHPAFPPLVEWGYYAVGRFPRGRRLHTLISYYANAEIRPIF